VTGATLSHRVQLRDDPIAGNLEAPDAIRLTRDYRHLNTSIYQQTWALLVQLISIKAACCSAPSPARNASSTGSSPRTRFRVRRIVIAALNVRLDELGHDQLHRMLERLQPPAPA
jgi:hypothetical protein